MTFLKQVYGSKIANNGSICQRAFIYMPAVICFTFFMFLILEWNFIQMLKDKVKLLTKEKGRNRRDLQEGKWQLIMKYS